MDREKWDRESTLYTSTVVLYMEKGEKFEEQQANGKSNF